MPRKTSFLLLWACLGALIAVPALAAGDAGDTLTTLAAATSSSPAMGDASAPASALPGVRLHLLLTQDLTVNAAGGLRTGTAGRGLAQGKLEVDLETFARWKGASALVGYAAERGTNGSELTGDAQAFSNIDAEEFAHVYEVWFEQRVADRLRVKLGRVDANTEFAVVEAAGGFLNASAGFSPTITGLPTYPDPQPSANVFMRVTPWLEASAAAYQGTFDDIDLPQGHFHDWFLIDQLAFGWGRGTAHVGRWQHTGMAVRFDRRLEEKPSEWYAAFEQRLNGTPSDDAPARGVRAFAKYGRAPGSVSVFERHWMGGLVLDGGLRPGSAQQAGIAFTFVDLSDDPDAGFAADETSFETFYRIPVGSFLVLKPDVQYIRHPSGDPAVADAIAATMRIDLEF